MNLNDLIVDLPLHLVRGRADTPITGVTEDSRRVVPGGLFVARPGAVHDGRRFVEDAVERGAVAVLADDPSVAPASVAILVPADDAPPLPALGARLVERSLGDPARTLQLVGVTGTNGKTTTVHLIHQLLNAVDRRCGLLGTVQIDDGATVEPAQLTTPPAEVISGALARMVEHGCVAAAMEVSSHALIQHRVAGLHFDAGVFTNLSGDHLDYHGTMGEYRDAKAGLFRQLDADAVAIVNSDDPSWTAMADAGPARVIRCGIRDTTATWTARPLDAAMTGTTVEFTGPAGTYAVRLPLVGTHNVSNAMQALLVAVEFGVPIETAIDGLARCTAPPGRLEPVTTPEDPWSVLVDYAHTDAALVNALGALRPLVPTGGRLRVVFGCGGDRDRSKRPRMAAAACGAADEIIITSDNPRTEDPAGIVTEVAIGVPEEDEGRVRQIVDRAEAIQTAVDTLRPGDILLIAGKGHEDYQIIGTERRDFDDRLVARQALRQRSELAEVT